MKICELNPFKLVYSYILMLLLSVFVVRGKESNGLVLCYSCAPRYQESWCLFY
jgi:hypothetical protein